MTRINTNVSSLVAQNTLGRSNADLNQALTRLSTGLRINTGKDDPAGLIASENLRSDITSIRRAISNTDRANQVIATADSALGQVSSLLNDIRGLVTESANSGALSDEQIAANQLQVDSSLEALNRIAQTTTFQGRRLLDGSLDFLTTAGTNATNLNDLQIDQANLGATGSVAVDIKVTTASTKALLDIANIPGAVTGVNSQGSITFSDNAVASTGTIGVGVGIKQATNGTITFGTGTLTVDALAGGNADGAEGNALATVTIAYSGAAGAVYTAATNTLAVTVTTADGSTDVTDIVAAIDAGTDFDATVGTNPLVDQGGATPATVSASLTGGTDAGTVNIAVTGIADADSNISIQVKETIGAPDAPSVTGDATNGYVINVATTETTTLAQIATAVQGLAEVATAVAATPAAIYDPSADSGLDDPTGVTTLLTGGFDAGDDIITINADTLGAANDRAITVTDTGDLGDDIINVTDNGTTLTVALDKDSTYNITDIAAAITGANLGYTASVTTNNVDGQYDSTADTAPTGGDVSALAGGVTESGGLAAALIIELSGANGAEVLSFGIGTSITDLIAGINLVSDATGVDARVNPSTSTTLQLRSDTYGSNALVDLQINSEGTGATPLGTFTTALGAGSRVAGADAVASINGVTAGATGNDISINTASLDISTSLTAGFTGTASFTITGGGALFQLGPDVVSNQQARLGIGSVNTSQLGGIAGKLFQLGDGGSAALSVDAATAAKIVEEAIDQVTTLRGRLGSFQRTTLETNKNALNDTLVNLTDAESKIRDADFASESAALTRAQILVQSGTTVLGISNQNPQNVLALLR